VTLSVRKGFKLEDFARLHPGGKIGKRLLRISDLMRTGDAVPAVRLNTPIRDAIYVMSNGRMGITAVVDDAGGCRESSPTATCGACWSGAATS